MTGPGYTQISCGTGGGVAVPSSGAAAVKWRAHLM